MRTLKILGMVYAIPGVVVGFNLGRDQYREGCREAEKIMSPDNDHPLLKKRTNTQRRLRASGSVIIEGVVGALVYGCSGFLLWPVLVNYVKKD